MIKILPLVARYSFLDQHLYCLKLHRVLLVTSTQIGNNHMDQDKYQDELKYTL